MAPSASVADRAPAGPTASETTTPSVWQSFTTGLAAMAENLRPGIEAVPFAALPVPGGSLLNCLAGLNPEAAKLFEDGALAVGKQLYQTFKLDRLFTWFCGSSNEPQQQEAIREKLAQINKPELTEAYERLVDAVKNGDQTAQEEAWQQLKGELAKLSREERAELLIILKECAAALADKTLGELVRDAVTLLSAELEQDERQEEVRAQLVQQLRPMESQSRWGYEWMLLRTSHDSGPTWAQKLAEVCRQIGEDVRRAEVKREQADTAESEEQRRVHVAEEVARRVVQALGDSALYTTALRNFLQKAENPQIFDSPFTSTVDDLRYAVAREQNSDEEKSRTKKKKADPALAA